MNRETNMQDDDEALAYAMRNPQQRHPDALVEVIAEMRRLDGLPAPYDPEDQWIPKAWGLNLPRSASAKILRDSYNELASMYFSFNPQTIDFLERDISRLTVIAALRVMALQVEVADCDRTATGFFYGFLATPDTPRGLDLMMQMKTRELEDVWMTLADVILPEELIGGQAPKDHLLGAGRPNFKDLPDLGMLTCVLGLHTILIKRLKRLLHSRNMSRR
jgi:hypothetical protein